MEGRSPTAAERFGPGWGRSAELSPPRPTPLQSGRGKGRNGIGTEPGQARRGAAQLSARPTGPPAARNRNRNRPARDRNRPSRAPPLPEPARPPPRPSREGLRPPPTEPGAALALTALTSESFRGGRPKSRPFPGGAAPPRALLLAGSGPAPPPPGSMSPPRTPSSREDSPLLLAGAAGRAGAAPPPCWEWRRAQAALLPAP